MTTSEERWNWIKGRVYYSVAGVLMWATLTGKLSLPELLHMLESLNRALTFIGR
jgi:hypothetical protein